MGSQSWDRYAVRAACQIMLAGLTARHLGAADRPGRPRSAMPDTLADPMDWPREPADLERPTRHADDRASQDIADMMARWLLAAVNHGVIQQRDRRVLLARALPRPLPWRVIAQQDGRSKSALSAKVAPATADRLANWFNLHKNPLPKLVRDAAETLALEDKRRSKDRAA